MSGSQELGAVECQRLLLYALPRGTHRAAFQQQGQLPLP
jgi:hypothetical protein